MTSPVAIRFNGPSDGAAFSELRHELEKKTVEYVHLAFPRYAPQSHAIFSALWRFLSLNNLQTTVYPKRPLGPADVATLLPRTKSADFSLEALQEYGILSSYNKIKDSGDDTGGDDPHDVHMYAGLYVLSAPAEMARPVVNHQEDYKKYRPHVEDSRLCRLPSNEEAYYTELAAIGATLGTVLYSEELSDGSHFHLQPSCSTGGETYVTDPIIEQMDGFKIYIPIIVDGQEKTLAFGGNVSVWGGVRGALMEGVPSKMKKETYSMAGASEVLIVLKTKN